jgi:hypothetical protein
MVSGQVKVRGQVRGQVKVRCIYAEMQNPSERAERQKFHVSAACALVL